MIERNEQAKGKIGGPLIQKGEGGKKPGFKI